MCMGDGVGHGVRCLGMRKDVLYTETLLIGFMSINICWLGMHRYWIFINNNTSACDYLHRSCVCMNPVEKAKCHVVQQ